MNLGRVAFGLSALLLCNACATTHDARPDANPPYWQIVQGTALSHIPDESDALAIWFECRPGPIVWTMTPAFDGRADRTIHLQSGSLSQRYAAKIFDNEATGEAAEADLRPDDPVLRAFRATGRLTLAGDWRLDATRDSEFKAIRTFFAHCR